MNTLKKFSIYYIKIINFYKNILIKFFNFKNGKVKIWNFISVYAHLAILIIVFLFTLVSDKIKENKLTESKLVNNFFKYKIKLKK
jgi:hypothetical protein